jgi:gamma-glutamylcyclotransferase (GGCT)/AIG2-like uncharacterized protein YtfP
MDYEEQKEVNTICNKLFCYGILKRGFAADLETEWDGNTFVSEALLPNAQLYAIGGGVGLRFTYNKDDIAKGEVFEIDPKNWPELDYLESNGFAYTRKVVEVYDKEADKSFEAWVYEHTFPGMEYDEPLEGNIYPNRNY